MYGSPTKTGRLQGSQAIEAYLPSWAKEEEVGAWSLDGEEDNSQEDKKNKCLVNVVLPCCADKSFWYRKLSLVIAFFLV